MPKKLTVVGALAAVVFGALSLFGSASTTSGVAVQDFTVNNTLCLTEPAVGVIGCPTSNATANSAAPTWLVTNLPAGSRLTLPVIYTPDEFGFAPGAVAATVGNVTAQTDILCDNVNDILAGGPGDPVGPSGGENALAPWPDDTVWKPFPFVHQGVAPAGADAYVSTIKATPSTYVPVSHDRSDLYTLWLGKAVALNLVTLQGAPTPLNSVVESVPAGYGTTGLRVAGTYLAGNPNPPSNSFTLCLDSPQDSVAENDQNVMPASDGLYPRWVTYTSDVDDRDGTVSRLIDVDCIQTGAGPFTDADGDCLVAASDPNDASADADGDLLPDGVEAIFGTSRTTADSDGDGADDFDEMFNFTNPDVADTDGDGSADKADSGADEVPGTVSVTDDTAADDNCPADAGAQTNTDAVTAGAVPADATAPTGDTLGDVCDSDDDNDGIVDVAELALAINNTATGYCKPADAGGPNVESPSLPLDGDTDNDRGLDGRECQFSSNPVDVAIVMAAQPQDDLGASPPTDPAGNDAQEKFFRTDSINTSPSTQNDNPDGDGLVGGPADGDSDNDKLNDGPEVKRYGTNPVNPDTDVDGCTDGREAATVNSDRSVSAIDLGLVASVFGAYPGSDLNKLNRDFDRNGSISAIDLGQVASLFGNCPAATGLNVNKDDDGNAP
jgi:hypothetical protein